MRTTIAMLAMMCATFAAADEIAAPAAIADAFIHALVAEDINAFAAIADSVDGLPMESTRDVVERYRCITVHSWRIVSADAGTIHLRIEATGFTRGTTAREVVLPRAWALEIACRGNGWRIVTAETEERRTARRLAKDPPADWLAELARQPELDVASFAHDLADEIAREAWLGYAPDAFEFALDLAGNLGDRAVEAGVLSMESVAETFLNHDLRALQLARDTLDAAIASGNADAMAMARFRLGFATWNFGRAEADDTLAAQGCASFDDAGSLADSIDDPRIAMKAVYMSGFVHRQRGNIRDAVLRSERVIELSNRYSWPEGAAMSRMAIGDVALTTRNYGVAAEQFKAAYRNAARVPSTWMMANALFAVAIAQMQSGDDSGGEETLARAEMLAHSIGHDASIGIALEVGCIRLRQGRLEEAERRLRRAQSDAWRTYEWGMASDASAALSHVRLLQGKPREALDLAGEALAEQECVAVSTIESSPWKALLAKGRALRALGDSSGAANVLREAVEAVETQREAAPGGAVSSAAFFEDKLEAWREIIDLLMENGDAPAAFAYAERMKGRALRDALAQGSIEHELSSEENSQDAELTDRLNALNREMLAAAGDAQRVAKLRTDLAEARLERERFEARIELTHPVAGVARAHASERFPQSLGTGAVVELVVDETHTHVFAVSATQVIGRTIAVTRDDLDRRLSLLERQIASRDLEWMRTARALDDLLLGPIGDSIAASRVICIVPDGVLWRLPFQVLTRLDRAAVFYAPSMAMVRETERRGSHGPNPTLIAFGNPALAHHARERVRAITRDATLGDLPDAESEVRAIGHLYGARARVYVRETARESVFKAEAGRAGIIHLAAHGVFDDDWPMYSAIVLAAAPGERDDGLLETREILGLHIGADIAVLASCETGRGRIRSGEGVTGMSWAFLVAGCPTTVVSQWPADSKATERLMVEFHRRLRAGSSPAAALRHAQRLVRADPRYTDPLYWASFIVMGAGMRAPVQ